MEGEEDGEGGTGRGGACGWWEGWDEGGGDVSTEDWSDWGGDGERGLICFVLVWAWLAVWVRQDGGVVSLVRGVAARWGSEGESRPGSDA